MKFDKEPAYYEALDKRTKEYKLWKEHQERQSEGLGDTVEKVAKAVGADKVAQKVASVLGFDDCGCDSRKEKLNKIFSYNRPDCLTEEEFVFLSEFFQVNRTRVTYYERVPVYDIYNRVFRTKLKPTSCPSCWRDVEMRLKKLIQAHRE